MLPARGIGELPCVGNTRVAAQPELASPRGQKYPRARTEAEVWQLGAACYVFDTNPKVGLSIEHIREKVQHATCHKNVKP
jgi:hypothetical protein